MGRNGSSRVRWVLTVCLAALCAGAAPTGGNWPSFRGPGASGVADGQKIPDRWDGARGENIKWKTFIPGLAHSSPVIWGDRLYVTTAVSSLGEATFKHGLFGEGDASPDRSVQQWKLYSLDKRTGRIVWETTAYEGVPREKRHVKSTYANSTPATDGRHVVVFFGSQGLYCYNADGRLLWKKDLGVLDLGAYDAPEYEWGTASSPIIFKNRVIVQCDTQKQDFLLALDLETGETVWKADRDELPSWGTPTIYAGARRIELVTNASKFIRGYDPETGKELWRLGGSSQITAPTPVWSGNLIVVASGRRPEAPIFVIRAGASATSRWARAAHRARRSPGAASSGARTCRRRSSMASYLYVLGNQGILDCYDFRSGKEIYRQRIAHQGGGFSGSPVAADGRIYLPSEDGDIFVVKAGTDFELCLDQSDG